MKGNLTILDSPYQEALKILSTEFERRDIKYAIFGGGAIQIHALAAENNFALNRGFFRKTGDVDLAVDAPLEDLIFMFNELTEQRVASNKNFGSAGIGPVNVNYCVPGTVKGFEDKHDLIIENSEYKRIKLGNQRFDLSVQSPELIIAAKLTGSFKPKDTADIDMLHTVLNINEEKIEAFLATLGKPEKIEVYRSITS